MDKHSLRILRGVSGRKKRYGGQKGENPAQTTPVRIAYYCLYWRSGKGTSRFFLNNGRSRRGPEHTWGQEGDLKDKGSGSATAQKGTWGERGSFPN